MESLTERYWPSGPFPSGTRHLGIERTGQTGRLKVLRDSDTCVITTTFWPLDPARLVRQSRRLLRDHLAGRIQDSSVVEGIEVMVSEVATNARLYCPPPYELRVVEHDGMPVVVEVADTGPGRDLVSGYLAAGAIPMGIEAIGEAALGLGGRGLKIVACLSEGRCGARPTQLKDCPSPGKSVWFAIPSSPTHRLQGDLA